MQQNLKLTVNKSLVNTQTLEDQTTPHGIMNDSKKKARVSLGTK